MGRSRTFTYRLEICCISGRVYSHGEWRIRSHKLHGPGMGQPTVENIKKWAREFEQSMIDGPNRHLGTDQVIWARVVRQSDCEVMAEWDRRTSPLGGPAFKVVS